MAADSVMEHSGALTWDQGGDDVQDPPRVRASKPLWFLITVTRTGLGEQ